MSPEVQIALISAVLVPVVTVFVVWLKRKLKLSDEAADAVSAGSPMRPVDTNQAITALGVQVGAISAELTELKVAFPQFVGWGKRGWEHVEPEKREPMPPLPSGFTEV